MNPKPSMKTPILYGGLIIGLISSIPFVNFINCFCCAGILLGGFLAVFFYKSNFAPDAPPLASADCLLVGLLAGILGAGVSTVLTTAFTAAFGNVTAQFVLDTLRKSNLQIPENSLRQLEDAVAEPFGVFRVIRSLFLSAIVSGIFGLLGGMIGYSVFKPKGLTPMAPPPGMPPPGDTTPA